MTLNNPNYTFADGKTTTATSVTAAIAQRTVKLSWSDPISFPYDGEEHSVTAAITNVVNDDDVSPSYTGNTATDAGRYTATVSGLSGADAGNYTLDGAANTTLPWGIGVTDIKDAQVALDEDTFSYDGTPHQPAVTVTLGESVLVQDTDYTVAYSGNSTDAGDYTVTVSGLGHYVGEATASYTITPAPLTITGASIAPKTYDGSADATVEGVSFGGLASGQALALGTDYTATAVFDNADAGTDKTVTVTVTLKNANYTLAKNTYDLTGQTIAKENDDGGSTGGGGGGGGGGGSSVSYSVIVEDAAHGTVTTSHERADRGSTVTVTVLPDNGYELASLTAADKHGDTVTLSPQKADVYTFQMPGSDVTVSAVFRAASGSCAQDNTCPIQRFTDASATAWYHDGVHYCLEKGLMDGMGNALFAPNSDLSRAMLVQIIYSLEGRPAISGGTSFADVAQGTWYFDAVAWAADRGIVKGYAETSFGPQDSITREQFAAILYRYAQYKGYDVSTGEDTDLLGYQDSAEISQYAIPAMRWACGVGLIEGLSESTLAPQGTATRAQAATMLMRLLEDVISPDT